MSGENVKANAGVAEGAGTAHGGKTVQAYDGGSRMVDADALLAEVIRTTGRAAAEAIEDTSPPEYNPRGADLTREEILRERRAWLVDGPKSKAIHARLGVSRSTLIRHRHRLGLVPWPRNDT